MHYEETFLLVPTYQGFSSSDLDLGLAPIMNYLMKLHEWQHEGF
jgi:hypothetical protein